MMKKFYNFIMDKEEVANMLEVLTKSTKYSNPGIRVGNCGWADEPNKWFVFGKLSKKEYNAVKTMVIDSNISVKVRNKHYEEVDL